MRAWLTSGDSTYYSDSRSSGHAVLDSPVLSLIQGVWALDPQRAVSILRNRIYLTGAPSALERAAVKVAAKRISQSASVLSEGSAREVPPAPGDFAKRFAPEPHQKFDHASCVVLLKEWTEIHARDFGRLAAPVVAFAIGPGDQWLGAAVNRPEINRTHHAELSLVQGHFACGSRNAWPAGTRVYVSLTPCKMCAAAIWSACSEPSCLNVFYLREDGGAATRGTVLQRGSNERRSVSRSRDELLAGIQVLIGE